MSNRTGGLGVAPRTPVSIRRQAPLPPGKSEDGEAEYLGGWVHRRDRRAGPYFCQGVSIRAYPEDVELIGHRGECRGGGRCRSANGVAITDYKDEVVRRIDLQFKSRSSVGAADWR